VIILVKKYQVAELVVVVLQNCRNVTNYYFIYLFQVMIQINVLDAQIVQVVLA